MKLERRPFAATQWLLNRTRAVMAIMSAKSQTAMMVIIVHIAVHGVRIVSRKLVALSMGFGDCHGTHLTQDFSEPFVVVVVAVFSLIVVVLSLVACNCSHTSGRLPRLTIWSDFRRLIILTQPYIVGVFATKQEAAICTEAKKLRTG
jgi:hypothetical protein